MRAEDADQVRSGVVDPCATFIKVMSTAMALSGAAFAGPAHAANECGVPINGVVTCTAAGNSYSAGITYVAGGDLTVVTSGDMVAANTLRASGSQTITVVNSGRVSTAANDSPGIVVVGAAAFVRSTGTVTSAGSASTVSGADALTLRATNGNATAIVNTLTSTGAVSAGTIPSAPRALVVSASGSVEATINGAVSSTNGDAVVMTSGTLARGGAAAVTIASNGSVVGGTNGLVITGRTSTTVINGGTINGGINGAALSVTTVSQSLLGTTEIINSGSIGSGQRLAILVAGGPATIQNAGRIDGVFRLTASSDTLVNSGLINVTGNSDFGDGTDSFVNGGTINVLGGAASPSTMEFTGLERFENSGTVSLANGQSYNTLTLPGTFSGSRASKLVLDVTTGMSPLADRLVVEGAATGSTAIVLNSLTPGNAGVTPSLTVATGGPGSSATAFTVAEESQNVGLVNYFVSPATAAGTTTYSVVGTPGDSVVRTLKINEGAQNLWFSSADAVAAHNADVRAALWKQGSDEPQTGQIWMIAHGGVDRRTDSKSTTAFGFNRDVNTSYQQDSFGIQLGADLGELHGLVLGLTGGYATSRLKLLGSSDLTSFDSVNGGLYARFLSGSVFANAAAKYDHAWVRSRSPVASFSASYEGKSYGLQGELGLQLGSDTFFVEPSVSGAYVRTDLRSPEVTNAVLDFDRLDGLRGKAGLRLGTAFDAGGRGRGVAYLTVNAVHEFEGRDGIQFISNATTFRYTNNRLGTYAEGKIGIDVVSTGVLSGFIEGFGKIREGYRGGGARAGLRLAL